jgi:hypothetical protein
LLGDGVYGLQLVLEALLGVQQVGGSVGGDVLLAAEAIEQQRFISRGVVGGDDVLLWWGLGRALLAEVEDVLGLGLLLSVLPGDDGALLRVERHVIFGVTLKLWNLVLELHFFRVHKHLAVGMMCFFGLRLADFLLNFD